MGVAPSHWRDGELASFVAAVSAVQARQPASKMELESERKRSLDDGSQPCRKGGGRAQDEQIGLREDEATRNDGS